MSDRTLVPSLALIVSISLSAALTAFATDNRQAPAALGAAGEVVDTALNERVEAALKSDPGLVGSKLAVATQAGVVTLGGTVPNEETMRRALELASNIRGVREVRSTLVIEEVH